MKRFTATGKKVFRDNHEGIYYVELNTGMRITVENDAEVMATLAWHESSDKDRETFLSRNNEAVKPYAYYQFEKLPQHIKDMMIAYQKSKMEIKV